MGHIRLGRLPKSKGWVQVFEAVHSDAINSGALATSAATALQKELLNLQRDKPVNRCFWILVQLATASRTTDFSEKLKELGVPDPRSLSPIDFVAHVAKFAETQNRRIESPSVFSRMAELSLRQVLTNRVIKGTKSLFGQSGIQEIQQTLRESSTQKNFGLFAREYFTNFSSRCINFIADKELSNAVGPGRSSASSRDLLRLQSDVHQFCFESSRILEDFAGGWFSKHNWETNNNITESETARFTAYALQKLATELPGGRS